jgi:hypothetical protein
MAHPNFELVGGDTFTFSNDTSRLQLRPDIVPPDSITVDSVTFTTPHDTFTLPITDFVVPPPVAEHVFEQATPSVAPGGQQPHGPPDER